MQNKLKASKIKGVIDLIKISLKATNLLPMSRNAATNFVKITDKFKSQISIVGQNLEINAKSTLGLMALGNANIEELVLLIEGADEAVAQEKLIEYINNVKNVDKL